MDPRTLAMKSSALSPASSRVKATTTRCCVPVPAISAWRSSSVVICGGQLTGSTTQRGWGSKVMQADVRACRPAAATSRSRTHRWPRWTPSKLPIASAVGPRRFSGSSKCLCNAGSAHSVDFLGWEDLVRYEGAPKRVGVAQSNQTASLVVRPEWPRFRLRKHPHRAPMSHLCLLLRGQSYGLHVGQQRLGRKQMLVNGLDVRQLHQGCGIVDP